MRATVLGSVAAVGALLLIALGARDSSAKPAICLQGTERLGLTPTGAVTWDGLSLQRSTTTGRYVTDAGQDFDVNNTNVLEAIDPQGTACTRTARALTLTVTDPFTGATSTVQAALP